VLDGDPVPLTERGTATPQIRPTAVARSPISATAELLFKLRLCMHSGSTRNAAAVDQSADLTSQLRTASGSKFPKFANVAVLRRAAWRAASFVLGPIAAIKQQRSIPDGATTISSCTDPLIIDHTTSLITADQLGYYTSLHVRGGSRESR